MRLLSGISLIGIRRPTARNSLVVPIVLTRWHALIGFIGVSGLAAIVKAMEPVALAPALDAALARAASPATSIKAVTLNNLGASLAAWLQLPGPEDRLATVLASVSLYAAVAAMAAILTFGAERLLRRITTSASAHLLCALHAHVLDPPLPFFLHRCRGQLSNTFLSD